MPRLTTRVKRRKDLGTTKRMHRYWKGKIDAKHRLPSFTTEEKAREWAKTHNISTTTHELRQLQQEKWQWRIKNPRLS